MKKVTVGDVVELEKRELIWGKGADTFLQDIEYERNIGFNEAIDYANAKEIPQEVFEKYCNAESFAMGYAKAEQDSEAEGYIKRPERRLNEGEIEKILWKNEHIISGLYKRDVSERRKKEFKRCAKFIVDATDKIVKGEK